MRFNGLFNLLDQVTLGHFASIDQDVLKTPSAQCSTRFRAIWQNDDGLFQILSNMQGDCGAELQRTWHTGENDDLLKFIFLIYAC
ncbi:hypothetical protein Dcae01_03314 [Deinococcus caeni]|uniref:Uncharacterized protein n=1 Tax=Deinococcus caeni TaxID=569127 RepID=A0ABP9UHR4_9DEIO